MKSLTERQSEFVGFAPPDAKIVAGNADDSTAVVTLPRKPDLEYWPNLIMRLALALGFAGLILSVFFALIYTFLRWVLA